MVITGQRFPLTCYFRKLSNRRPEIGLTVFVVAAPKLFSIIHPITENEVPPLQFQCLKEEINGTMAIIMERHRLEPAETNLNPISDLHYNSKQRYKCGASSPKKEYISDCL